jgi:CRISPR-associated protein Csm1
VEKWELLNNFFEGMDTERGMAFLYRILELLRNADNKINLARLAYMLTRLEPDTSHVEKQPLYNQFAGRVMDWAADGEERKKLEAAIMIYIYGKRKKKEG